MCLAVCFNGVFKEFNTFTGIASALESVIRASSNQWFHVMPVWIYAIAGDVIVSYHRQVSARLLCATASYNSLDHNYEEKLCDFLQCMDGLVDIAESTTRRLSPMLLANVFSSLLFTLTFTFRAIENVKKQEVIASIWDVSDVMDASIRFWVVAHTADRLRSVVKTHHLSLIKQRVILVLSLQSRHQIKTLRLFRASNNNRMNNLKVRRAVNIFLKGC